jgi:hypothetical protein
VTDNNNDELGWGDPMVVLGAIALVVVIVWIVISIAAGHNPFHRDGQPGLPSPGRYVVPALDRNHHGIACERG